MDGRQLGQKKKKRGRGFFCSPRLVTEFGRHCFPEEMDPQSSESVARQTFSSQSVMSFFLARVVVVVVSQGQLLERTGLRKGRRDAAGGRSPDRGKSLYMQRKRGRRRRGLPGVQVKEREKRVTEIGVVFPPEASPRKFRDPEEDEAQDSRRDEGAASRC